MNWLNPQVIVLPQSVEVRSSDTSLFGSRDDLMRLQRNHDELARILKALGIEIDWFPSG